MLFSKNLIPLAFASVFAIFSCKNTATAPQADATGRPKDITLNLEPELSTDGATEFKISSGILYWSGKSAVGGTHNGTLKISGGTLLVKENRLVDGTVQLDMTSLANADIQDAADRADLEKHLKSADFFDVNRYPTAEFDVQEVLPSQMPDFNRVVSGDLSMHGKKVEVNVPVKLNIEGKKLTAKSATFIVDRTKWDIKYKSTVLKTVANELIEDMLTLGFEFEATAN